MSIKQELEKLKAPDLWSLMLFVLYKVRDIPEYSSLSELAYVLDEKNMLRLCEYFGGTTITIPTIDEMEKMIYGLLLYYYVEHQNLIIHVFYFQYLNQLCYYYQIYHIGLL